MAIALPIAACNVDVRRHESDGKADVDITTPVGNVSVRTNVDTPDTGLAVYPGARPLQDEDEPESADVTVGNSMFGVKVLAAKFESADAQERIIDFYRNELKAYGDVTECRGNVNYRRGRRGLSREAVRTRPAAGRRSRGPATHRLGEAARRRDGVRSRLRSDARQAQLASKCLAPNVRSVRGHGT